MTNTTNTTNTIDFDKAERYIPADPRTISRILKAAGFKRAEDHLDYGFAVSEGFHGGASIRVWFGQHSEGSSKARRILGEIHDLLKAQGYRIDPRSDSNVFRPAKSKNLDDHYAFWFQYWKIRSATVENCHVLIVDPATGNLVRANEVPEWKAEKVRRDAERAWEATERKAVAEAERVRSNALKARVTEALEARGMSFLPSSSSVEGSTRLSVSFGDLAKLLGVEA